LARIAAFAKGLGKIPIFRIFREKRTMTQSVKSEQQMPETNRTLELAQHFREAASAETAMPYYAEMMRRAAADLEAFARDRAAAQTRPALPSAA